MLCISQSFRNHCCSCKSTMCLISFWFFGCNWLHLKCIDQLCFGDSFFHLLIVYFMGQCTDKHLSTSSNTQRLMGPAFVSWAWLAWIEHMGGDGGRWCLITLQRVWMTALETRKQHTTTASVRCFHCFAFILCALERDYFVYYIIILLSVWKYGWFLWLMMIDCSESISNWISHVLSHYLMQINADAKLFSQPYSWDFNLPEGL